MRRKTLFALLVIGAGTMAVLLSLVSIEQAQYTAPPPAQTPVSQEVALMPNRKHTTKTNPLPAEETDAQVTVAPTPTPVPMDRQNYGDGDLWIQIPAIEVDVAVINGTEVSSLKKGPGLYEKSPMPDTPEGNVCIAGHRTTYGAWFRHVDTLAKGDTIILYGFGKQFVYEVEEIFIVDRYDWSVTDPVDAPVLTLTACHPPGSARQRIVVRANQTKILPV